jgi:hypothetical protein
VKRVAFLVEKACFNKQAFFIYLVGKIILAQLLFATHQIPQIP